jgi:hypothetical protein
MAFENISVKQLDLEIELIKTFYKETQGRKLIDQLMNAEIIEKIKSFCLLPDYSNIVNSFLYLEYLYQNASDPYIKVLKEFASFSKNVAEKKVSLEEIHENVGIIRQLIDL